MPRPVAKLSLLVVLALLFLPAATRPGLSADASAPGVSWQTSLNADNPLVGKIYSVSEKLFLSPGELIDRLAGERFVLLGEIHDNPDHHRLQAFVITELTRRGRRPGVVMEQITADQEGLLNLFQSGRNRTAERLGPAIEWDGKGWPAWKFYQPIAAAAFDAGLSIYAGDDSKDIYKKIGKEGLAVIGSQDQQQLGLAKPLAPPLETALVEDLVLSHCSMMPAERMRPMLYVQRYRDAVLARSLRKADSGDGAVLTAGNGHVRTDRAVPWYLRETGLSSRTLMIVEATKEAGDPIALLPPDPDGKPTADFIWVTPGAEREDPCEGLKRHLKK
jgi:uncharacterized iron-regulated protein